MAGGQKQEQYDFVTVVVHEIAHGLGFAGSMNVSSGMGQYGYSGQPTAFDHFAENANTLYMYLKLASKNTS